MIYKRVGHRYLVNGEPGATMLKVASGTGRIDASQLRRLNGGRDTPLLQRFDCPPGYSLIHAIAVGAHEKWGTNSNADAFPEAATRLLPYDPKDAKVPFIDTRKGLVDCHKSYEKEGGLYYEHFNRTKGAKKKGKVLASIYNEPMKRVELIIQVANDEHPSLLKDIEAGEPTFVSQGCSVPEDICSACLNRARTPDEYCDHVKKHKLHMLKEGRLVFVWNPEPKFHDISIVRQPAWIPAFVLGMRKGQEKAASIGGIVTPADFTYGSRDFIKVASGLSIPDYAILDWLHESRPEKMGLVVKLAKMEKEIPMQVSDAIIGGVRIPEATRRKLAADVGSKSPAAVVSWLKNEKLCLPPSVFQDILIAEQPSGRAISEGGYRRALQSVFSDLLDDPEALQEVVDNDDYQSDRPSDGRDMERYREDLTLEPDTVLKKAEKISLGGGKVDKPEASGESNDQEKALAREYARYLLAALKGSRDGNLKVATLKKHWD